MSEIYLGIRIDDEEEVYSRLEDFKASTLEDENDRRYENSEEVITVEDSMSYEGSGGALHNILKGLEDEDHIYVYFEKVSTYSPPFGWTD